MHPRGTRVKRAIVAFFHCERSSRKFIGELLPGKNFPTSHPSTITQLLLERPSASLSYAFLKVSVISRHCNAYRVVIYTTRLWGGLQLSHICHPAGACCRVVHVSQALSRGESTPHFSTSVQGTLKPERYIPRNVTSLPFNLACIG